MMKNNFIKGIGMTTFGVHSKPSHLLAYDAVYPALEDADMSMNDIDAIVVSNLEWFYSSERQRHMASQLSALLKTRIPIIRAPGACAGGGNALWIANKLLKNDANLNNILVLGVEKLMETTFNSEAILDEFMMAFESKWEQAEGIHAPCQAALTAQAYFNKFPDASTNDLDLIAFKNHSNGARNPNALFYGRKVSLEEIKNAPIIASPLKLFDCSISADGAAAAVLSRDKAGVELIASANYSDSSSPFERGDMSTWETTVLSAKEAFSQCGLEPWDMDFYEIHDAFSIVELISYEDLGLAKKGEGAKLIRDKVVCLDGKMPVNPSGGLKAKGHPVSATGLGMVYEIVNQMRGGAGERQVSNVRKAFAHNIGGTGGVTTANIFKRVGG